MYIYSYEGTVNELNRAGALQALDTRKETAATSGQLVPRHEKIAQTVNGTGIESIGVVMPLARTMSMDNMRKDEKANAL